jgi:hypothetical protein
MNPLFDLELIESAVLSGEVDDAMNLIRKRKKSLPGIINAYKSEKFRSHLKVILGIEGYLEDRETFDSMLSILETNFVYDVDDREGFISNFTYHLYYSKDRYNVRFPHFEGKRCDDL